MRSGILEMMAEAPNVAYVRFKKFPRLRADLARFAILLAYLLYHGKRMRNGLNEPGEDFIGTRMPNIAKRKFVVDLFVFLCSNGVKERLSLPYLCCPPGGCRP